MAKRGRPPINFQEQLLKHLTSLKELLFSSNFPGLSSIIEHTLNTLLTYEQEHYLQNNPQEYRNGYYPRTLLSSFGKLNIKVPRVRFGNSFRPALLPKHWQRYNLEYENFILACLSNGYSKAKIKNILDQLSIPFSQDAIDGVSELIYEKLHYFKSRPVPEELFALFIDAYHTEVKDEGKMKKISIFVAIGIDLQGYKHILGYWVMKGGEKIGFWTEVFQDLISRGLSKVLIIVTDDFSGISGLIKKLFPKAEHQLCILHLYRNLVYKLNLKSRNGIYRLFRSLKEASDYEEGEKVFKELIELVKRYDGEYAKVLERKKEQYLAFLRYPEEVRRHIYTTNIVESVNAGLEYMRRGHGGYFASEEMLEINLFIQLSNLHSKWMERPHPSVAGVIYKIRQMFVLRYRDLD